MSLPILLQIFRAGRHVAASGEAISFSDSDVRSIASSYDPSTHEAPVVVGHPKDNAPAYGWVRALGVRGGVLTAHVDQIDPAFAELVRAKRYKKISASFYRPDSEQNPKPGQYYLRHVGFLGAQPPAVKGLKDASFAGASEDVLELELAETEAGKSDPPAETTTAVDAIMAALPPGLSDELRQQIRQAVSALLDKAEEESDDGVGDGATATNLAERRRLRSESARLAALEQQVAADRRAHRRERWASFLEDLRKEGRMLPCKRETVLAFMDLLAGDAPQGSVSFGESERRSPVEIFQRDFLAKLPRQVDFRELAPGGDAEDFGEDPREIAARATAYQAEQKARGVVVTAAQAVAHVTKKR